MNNYGRCVIFLEGKIMINPVFFFFTPNQTLVVSHFYKYLGYELNEKYVCWFYNISFFFQTISLVKTSIIPEQLFNLFFIFPVILLHYDILYSMYM